jgi:VanZ family protein
MGLIFYFSSRQQPQVLRNAPDSVLHFLEYVPLGFLAARGLRAHRRDKVRPVLVLFAAAALSAAYGITDELHQSFVPGRFCTVSDMAADGIGSLAGAAIHTIGAVLMTRGTPSASGGKVARP